MIRDTSNRCHRQHRRCRRSHHRGQRRCERVGIVGWCLGLLLSFLPPLSFPFRSEPGRALSSGEYARLPDECVPAPCRRAVQFGTVSRAIAVHSGTALRRHRAYSVPVALVSLTDRLTTAQRHAARDLIPAGFEANLPLQRDTPDPHSLATSPLGEPRPCAAVATAPYVVAAPARPTTLLGRVAAILGDLGLIAAVLFVAAAVPTLIVWAIYLAGALILDTWQRQ